MSRERQRLVTMVNALAAAIDAGDVTPEPGELEALAALLDRVKLTTEAARVRRWISS